MTARFLEILAEVQAKAGEMVIHRDVIRHGPYWPGINGGFSSVKNRYNDVLISNVTSEQAEEIAALLNRLEN